MFSLTGRPPVKRAQDAGNTCNLNTKVRIIHKVLRCCSRHEADETLMKMYRCIPRCVSVGSFCWQRLIVLGFEAGGSKLSGGLADGGKAATLLDLG